MTDGIKYVDGFETAPVTNTLTRHADYARTGNFGIGWSDVGFPSYSTLAIQPLGIMSLGFAFKRSTGSGGGVIAQVKALNGLVHINLGIDSQQLLYVETPSAGGSYIPRGIGTRRLSLDTWHYVELYALAAASGGELIVQLDGKSGAAGTTGAEIISLSGIPTIHVSGDTLYTVISLGVLSGFVNDDHNYAFDDLYIRNTDAFLGDFQANPLILSADRAIEFSRNTGAANYETVDDVTPDEDTSYNQTEVDDAEDFFEMTNVSFPGLIHGVQLTIRSKRTEPEDWNIEASLDLSATKVYGTLNAVPYPDYTTLTPDWFGDAPGSSGWTLTQLNNVGVGYRATTA